MKKALYHNTVDWNLHVAVENFTRAWWIIVQKYLQVIDAKQGSISLREQE